MARILLLFSFAVYLINPADMYAASYGRIMLYSDAGLSECSLTNMGSGITDVYVVHSTSGTDGANLDFTGIVLRLTPSTGFNGAWLEDIVPAGMSSNGTSPSGIGIGYGTCRFGELLALHVRYEMQGPSLSCSFVEAVPYPSYPWIIETTCGEGLEFPVDDGRIFVNPDSSCPCEAPLATEPTTWGRIKAMYR